MADETAENMSEESAVDLIMKRLEAGPPKDQPAKKEQAQPEAEPATDDTGGTDAEVEGDEPETDADDIEIDVAAESNAEAKRLLQPFLKKVARWAKKWHFEFSVDKSALVVFTRDAASHPPVLHLMGHRIPSTESTKFLGLHLDRKLLWKQHIDKVIDKIVKANNIFSVIAKRHTGPSVKTLLLLYKTLIRSQADYGLIVYGTAAATHIERLDVALRVSLRTTLGALKSTKREVLYSELGLEPTAQRREWLAAKYCLRLGRKPLNATYASTHSLAHRGPSTLTPSHTPCLTAFLTDVRKTDSNAFALDPDTRPAFFSPPPWMPPLTKALWFQDSKSKAVADPAAARLKIQRLVDDLPSDSLLVFTDGSHQEEPNRTACAFFIPKWSTEKAFLLHEGASIFTAEVAAINRALRHIYSHDCLVAGQEIFVFSDSQAAVRSIISMAAIKEEIVLETLDAIACLKSAGNAVTLVWIPSHIGVIGNDKADSLAVAECKAPSNRAKDSTLSVTEAVAKYKKTWCETRRKELHKSKKVAVRFHTTPTVTPWHFSRNRSASVTMFRLRNGHTHLNEFIFSRIDEGTDPSCRLGCEALENIYHVLFDCVHHDQARRKLASYFHGKNITFDLKSVLGLNLALDRATQCKISDLLSDYILASKINEIV